MTSPLEEVNKAYEDAVSAERQRRESLEAQEIGMDADALHRRLKEERQRMAKISGELAKLKITSLQRESSNEFHEEEEFNMFLKCRKEAPTDHQHPSQSIESQTIVRHNLPTQNHDSQQVQEMLREEQKLNSVLQKKLKNLQDENLKLKKQLESSSSSSSTSPSTGLVGSGTLPPITDFGDEVEDEEAEEEEEEHDEQSN